MPSEAKYRRTYFAVCKALGMSEADRHVFNASHVGKESTREWTGQEFDQAVAELQRMAGQHNNPHAHVRAERESDMATEPGDWATDEQCALIEALCDEIEWKAGRENGPVAFVSKRFFDGEENILRRRLLQEGRGMDRWKCLTRQETSGVILALEAMTQTYPVEVNA